VSKEIGTFLGTEVVNQASEGFPECAHGRIALARSSAFKLANACSSGFRSGLFGGINISFAPAPSIASRNTATNRLPKAIGRTPPMLESLNFSKRRPRQKARLLQFPPQSTE
jgi:hypothetical protein